MSRPMKYHIYNLDNYPLCFGEQALEFDTREQAFDFASNVFEYKEDYNLVEDILFYDDGYLDASNLMPIIDPETQDVILISKEEKEKDE